MKNHASHNAVSLANLMLVLGSVGLAVSATVVLLADEWKGLRQSRPAPPVAEPVSSANVVEVEVEAEVEANPHHVSPGDLAPSEETTAPNRAPSVEPSVEPTVEPIVEDMEVEPSKPVPAAEAIVPAAVETPMITTPTRGNYVFMSPDTSAPSAPTSPTDSPGPSASNPSATSGGGGGGGGAATRGGLGGGGGGGGATGGGGGGGSPSDADGPALDGGFLPDAGGPTDEELEPHEAGTLPTAYRDRVTVWLTVGGATLNQDGRRMQKDLLAGGWDLYIERRVKPMLDLGARRLVLSIPFGYRGPGVFQFDQLLEMREEIPTSPYGGVFAQIDAGFVDAWKPIVQGAYTDGDPVEVICYLGKLKDDPDFTELDDAAYRQRYYASIQPALDAGMSLGFDASSGINVGTREHDLIAETEANGTRCYIEARPLKISPWRDWPVISTETIWDLTNDPTLSQNRRYYETHELGGEVMRFVSTNRWPDHWQRLEMIVTILEEGHTASVGTNDLPRVVERLEQ
ncbi:MAG: hypothetical protein AAF593_14510, partial [Planctomycetota bacterium]